MPQQPFIMRLHYYLPGGTKLNSLQSGAHHVEYMGSADKDELLLAPDDGDRNTLDSAAIHAQYAGEREGSMGYFGSAADDPKAAQAAIQSAQGSVWRVIASVGEQDTFAMGGDLTTKDGWERASSPAVAKMVEQLGLDPAKVQWIAAAHRHQKHENNPHIHLLLWEMGTPSRKTAKWTAAERQAIRREWIHELYRPERERLGQEKSEARNQTRSALLDLIGRRNHQQGFHRELGNRLKDLGTMLPGQGRLAYAYMPAAVKQKVENTIRWLWTTDPGLKAQHDKYVETAERMGTFYWHRDPEKTENTPGRQAARDRIHENAERDLIKRLAAPVLKAAQKESRSPSQGLRPSLRGNALQQTLHRMIRAAERDARMTACWLAESQWQHQQAEQAIARSTGQELVL